MGIFEICAHDRVIRSASASKDEHHGLVKGSTIKLSSAVRVVAGDMETSEETYLVHLRESLLRHDDVRQRLHVPQPVRNPDGQLCPDIVCTLNTCASYARQLH